MTQTISMYFSGASEAQLWGMELREWQRRTWAKLGAAVEAPGGEGRVILAVDWVLSQSLRAGLLQTPGAALVVPVEGQGVQLVALHLSQAHDLEEWRAQVGQTDPDLEALKAAGFTPVSVDELAGQYVQSLRKRETPYALSMAHTAQKVIEKRLFDSSYKGVTDLVTKYAWPWPAFHVTRACAKHRITPNTVTSLSLVLVLVAFWLFWNGHWGLGIVAGWAMTFLDTVDGKLARTTMTYSKWGNVYDHGIDLIHPPFWYWAIWHGLSEGAPGISQGVLDLSLWIIIVGYVLNRVEEGIFIWKFGFDIHVWERIDSISREITARRNPNMLIFMLSVILLTPEFGFVAVAVWTLAWLIFHAVRIVQALAQKEPVTSWLE